MKTVRNLFASIRGHVRLRVVALMLLLGMLAAIATPPAWWAVRGVTNGNAADDYAPLNQGQLKNLVKAAALELDSTLAGGAGDTLHAMITRWATPSAQTDDYAAVNLGQLKAVARPVYDRLKAVGYASAYPWESSGQPPDDYAMANIGQAKSLFAFQIEFTDADENGLSDEWEARWGLSGVLADDIAPGDITYRQKFQFDLDPTKVDTDGDGVSDGSEIAAGTNPKDPSDKPPVTAEEVALSSSISESGYWTAGGGTGEYETYNTGSSGTGVLEYPQTDPVTGEVLPPITKVLSEDQVAEYESLKALPPGPREAGEGPWITEWLIEDIAGFDDVDGNPCLRGSWECTIREISEIQGESEYIKTGAMVYNGRLASLPTPGPEDLEEFAGKYRGGATYDITDDPEAEDGDGIKVTRAEYEGVRGIWQNIDAPSAEARVQYSDGGQLTTTQSEDGSSENRTAFWLKTSDGSPATAPFTRTYLKITKSIADGSVLSSESISPVIEIGQATSGVVFVNAAPGQTVSVVTVSIQPDANMAGVIGDTIPSIKETGGEKHFVTPKAAPSVFDPIPMLALTAGTGEDFDELYEWEVKLGETSVAVIKSANVCYIPRTQTAHYEVKVRGHGINGTPGPEVDKMNVWVVWATCDGPSPAMAPWFQVVGTAPKFGVGLKDQSLRFGFRFVIKPSELFTEGADVPDLNKNPDPAVLVPDGEHAQSIGRRWQDGVTKDNDTRWDITRSVQITINNPSTNQNPHGISAVKMGGYQPGAPLYTRRNNGAYNGVLEPWPTNDLAGNDDATSGDEDSNPYRVEVGNFGPHGKGEVCQTDMPNLVGPVAFGLNEGTVFGDKSEFREFVRVQLGGRWYRVSDWFVWKFELKAIIKNGQWSDNGSDYFPK